MPPAPHVGQPPALLPATLLQRYLEHLLLPPPPQLGYEEALLHPYSYHKVCSPSPFRPPRQKGGDGQGAAAPPAPSRCRGWGGGSAAGCDPRTRFWLQFGYQDSAHQLPGSTARQSPETTSLLGRVPAQALFGAGSVPSYGGQPGADGGHLFQDLGMLSLPREKNGRTDPAGTRLPHGLRLPGDFRDVEEREQPAPLAAQPPLAQTGTGSSRSRLSIPFAFTPASPLVQPVSSISRPKPLPAASRALGRCRAPT